MRKLLVLVRPDSTFDERKAAAAELAVAAYKRGRDDAILEMAEVLADHGFALSDFGALPAAVRLQ